MEAIGKSGTITIGKEGAPSNKQWQPRNGLDLSNIISLARPRTYPYRHLLKPKTGKELVPNVDLQAVTAKQRQRTFKNGQLLFFREGLWARNRRRTKRGTASQYRFFARGMSYSDQGQEVLIYQKVVEYSFFHNGLLILSIE